MENEIDSSSNMTSEKKAQRPVFSIVLPSFNRANILPRSIACVLNQTYKNYEFIIVDDGSTDATREVISQFPDTRIRYVLQQNQGPSAARNTGAALARGEYLTFLDSDDEVLPEWLEMLEQAFSLHSASVVCCGYRVADDRQGDCGIELPKDLGPVYYHYRGLFVPPGTLAMRTELFQKLGGYVPELRFSENTDLFLRITAELKSTNQKIDCISSALVVYHRQSLRYARSESNFSKRLHAARYFLEHHGARYLNANGRSYANYCAIAGVNAARLGYVNEARTHFRNAIRANPQNVRHYARLFLTFFPDWAQAYWLRFNREA